MTLYRKYRPQKIGELDSEEIRERLAKIFSSSYFPHAFLFSGPKGTGKTSAARIVAKVLNCEQRTVSVKDTSDGGPDFIGGSSEVEGSNIEPCNSCETCISITEGRNLDVLEIDAASNRGIDEMRDLREKVKLAPISAKFKVYIIDEVHMLTTEAFNALLKTLEEPPSHAVFILATTEPQRLPSTIVSRCTTYNFQKASRKEILHCLKRVIEGEKVKVPDEGLETIADSSDGSFRDATKILEQAILEKALSEQDIKRIIGRNGLSAEKFLIPLIKKEVNLTLSEVKKMSETGVNFRYLVEDMLNLLHKILLLQHEVEEKTVDRNLAESLSTKEVLLLIKLFSRVYVELKNTSMPSLPLEVAIVEWCEK